MSIVHHQRGVLLLSVAVATMAPHPALSANHSWKNQSRMAHQLMKEGRLRDALHRYDLAIAELKTQQQQQQQQQELPTLLDLQLNKVQLLVDDKRISEAETLWKSLGAEVTACGDPFVEIRYWRRARDLAEGRRNFVLVAKLDVDMMQLIKRTMGRGSQSYVNAVKASMESATSVRLWEPATNAAFEMKQLLSECPKPAVRQQIRHSLACFLVDSARLTDPELKKGDLSKVAALLESFQNYSPTPQILINRWDTLLKVAISKPDQEAVIRKCCDNLLRIEEHLGEQNKQDRQAIATALLETAVKDVYNEEVRAETEERLRSASEIMTRVKSASELHSNLFYVQCASLHALALAKRGQLEASEKRVDDVLSPGVTLKQVSNYYGTFQALFRLATAFYKKGDKAAVGRQFKSIYLILDSVDASSLQKGEKAYWHNLGNNMSK